jgi:hypothetical protein
MTIRNYLILSIGIASLVVINTSCKKIKKLTTFTIVDSTEFIVPASTGVNIPLVLNTQEVTTSSSQSFSNNNTNANLIKDIKLTALNLTIIDPSGETFHFLNSIKIYIYGNGQPQILLASKENIATDSTNSVELEPSKAYLDTYIKSSAYSLRYEIITADSLMAGFDITIRNKMTFSVTASPL